MRCIIGFPFISVSHADLVIPTSHVNFGEDGGAMQLIEHVIKPWYRLPIVVRDAIYGPTIHTLAERTILVGHR